MVLVFLIQMRSSKPGAFYSQGYVEVLVREPMILETEREGRYTSYEVRLEVRNRARGPVHQLRGPTRGEFQPFGTSIHKVSSSLRVNVLPHN